MKKLAYLVSAISAAAFSTAHADISVSGSASAAYTAAGGNTSVLHGGAVSFGLSTTSDSGMTFAAGAGITRDTDAGDATTGATGLSSLTITTGGVSIAMGYDIGLPDGVGVVGEVVTVADHNSRSVSNTAAVGDDEGAGISLTTPVGGASLTLTYLYDLDADTVTVGDLDGAAETGTGASVSSSIAGGTLTAAYNRVSSASSVVNNETGISFAYPAGGGTLTVGYTSTSGDTASNNGTAFGAKYAMSLEGTAITLGYQSYDVNSTSGNSTDIVVSRALGGGASVFAEMRTTNGTVTASSSTDGADDTSTMAIGTSVSF